MSVFRVMAEWQTISGATNSASPYSWYTISFVSLLDMSGRRHLLCVNPSRVSFLVSGSTITLWAFRSNVHQLQQFFDPHSDHFLIQLLLDSPLNNALSFALVEHKNRHFCVGHFIGVNQTHKATTTTTTTLVDHLTNLIQTIRL
ncbi:hypothetical protein BpHYR1_012121 [Brachionus plicatilis]|uniref:Uncharacterized protein n=1 Tax=Brachionus plicatilis TaxID=10195 RepID=A0A3M7SZS7_BRAPC|nr:hypothetical protein BpHYR1_012121 [Brachionus plicatilis]